MPTLNEDRLNKGRRSTYQAPDRYRALIEITEQPTRRRLDLTWPLIIIGCLIFGVGVWSLTL
jgi:hypothetical protein